MEPQARTIEVHPLTPPRWDDLVDLFERPGPRGGRQDTANCWCVVWRSPFGSPDENKRQLCDLVHDGEEPGLVGYRDGSAVGWVSVAPRAHFSSLLRSTQFRPRDDDPDVFVVTCFVVDRRVRRQGMATALLSAAVDRAMTRGARAVEGYPADPPDYKGPLPTFIDYGFVPVRTVGKRTIVRYDVR